MALAATAKRRSGLNSDGSKAIKRSSSGGSTTSSGSSSTSSVVVPAPQNASLSEKRRMAALISWEKRRKSSAKRAAKEAKEASSKRKASAVGVVPITPPKNKERKKAALERQKQKQLYRELYAPPPSKKHKVNAGSKGGRGSKSKEQENDPTERKVYTADDRAAAAKLGWERRAQKKQPKHQKQQEQPSATDIRRQAAKLGWEKRRNEQEARRNEQEAQMSASDIRRKAAKLGWERRNKKLMAESSGSSAYASDESSGDERSISAESSVDSSSTAEKKKTSVAASRKVYTASARRQAAILGWEKRRNEKAARRASATSYDEGTTSIALLQPPKLAPLMTTTTETSSTTSSRPPKNYRQGTKRSRRLADESTDSYEDEARKVNELVTYLRMTRGWMEFHPSSRHGSGTATYGYIPSGIASFIRSGAISQRTVLDHGTLGVHYALDWDGYGGLKDMINTFGEDYSPYPTEEMMELSKLTEWELGEDLPWREVEAAEEQERLKEEGDNKGKFTDVKVDQESGTTANAEYVGMEDITFFANILASLDGSATVPAVEDIGSASKESVMATKFKGRRASNDRVVPSPSILALRGYESSSDDDDDNESDTKENNQTAATGGNISPMSTLADACEVSKHQHHQHYKPSVSGKHPHRDFSHWNFGIC